MIRAVLWVLYFVFQSIAFVSMVVGIIFASLAWLVRPRPE